MQSLTCHPGTAHPAPPGHNSPPAGWENKASTSLLPPPEQPGCLFLQFNTAALNRHTCKLSPHTPTDQRTQTFKPPMALKPFPQGISKKLVEYRHLLPVFHTGLFINVPVREPHWSLITFYKEVLEPVEKWEVSAGMRLGWAGIRKLLSPPGRLQWALGSVLKSAGYFRNHDACTFAVHKKPEATVKWPPAEA